MKVLSLFDGISVARYAISKIGVKRVDYYASEIDIYARQVAKRNWPDTHFIGGVHGVVKARFPHLFDGSVDLVIGGSPCQDLSIAKAGRQGLKGSRSGLFYEFVRIVQQVKPKYFVLENVASMRHSDRDEISRILGVQPIMIDAGLVSAQTRKRYFWTNIPGVVIPKDRGIMLEDIMEKEVPERYYFKGKIGNSIGNRVSGRKGKAVALRALGGGGGAKTGLYFVGGIGDKDWAGDGKKLSRNYPQGRRVYSARGKASSLSASGVGGVGGATGLYMIGRGRGKNKGYRSDKKTPALTASSWEHNNFLSNGRRVRRLTPVECERLQSLPDGYTRFQIEGVRYMVLGNAFNAEVVRHILSHRKW